MYHSIWWILHYSTTPLTRTVFCINYSILALLQSVWNVVSTTCQHSATQYEWFSASCKVIICKVNQYEWYFIPCKAVICKVYQSEWYFAPCKAVIHKVNQSEWYFAPCKGFSHGWAVWMVFYTFKAFIHNVGQYEMVFYTFKDVRHSSVSQSVWIFSLFKAFCFL